MPNCCTRTFNKYPGWAGWARVSILSCLFVSTIPMTAFYCMDRSIRQSNSSGKERCVVFTAEVASQYITTKCGADSDSGSCCAYQCSCTIGTVTGRSIQAQEIVVSRPILSVDFPECGIPEELLCGPVECSDSLSGLEVGDTWDCWVSNEDLISTTAFMSPWVWACLALGILSSVLVLLLAAFFAFTLIVPFVEDRFPAMGELLNNMHNYI
ncbi:hypothetical protein Pelo_11192 [Pelomyxa schiedti]|nr:hypothetical protein Pelo_11192 [Pelomyxa schiedti]